MKTRSHHAASQIKTSGNLRIASEITYFYFILSSALYISSLSSACFDLTTGQRTIRSINFFVPTGKKQLKAVPNLKSLNPATASQGINSSREMFYEHNRVYNYTHICIHHSPENPLF